MALPCTIPEAQILKLPKQVPKMMMGRAMAQTEELLPGSFQQGKPNSLCPAQLYLSQNLMITPTPVTHLLFQATQQAEEIYIIYITLCYSSAVLVDASP